MPHLETAGAQISALEDANKALVRRFLEAADAAGALDPVMDLLAPDAVIHLPGFPPFDREGFRQFASVMWTAFPDLVHTFEEQIAVGDRVVNRFTVRGTHRGDFQGIPPTGRAIEYQGISIYHISDGKVAELWAVADFLGLMQQIGAIPAPGQAQA